MSIIEEYAHQYNSNNLTENKVSEEVNSSSEEKKKFQKKKFQPRMATDKMDMAVDESTLVKFRNNFFEVTISLNALFVRCSVMSTSP